MLTMTAGMTDPEIMIMTKMSRMMENGERPSMGGSA
jgi:hypothetical protein